MFYLEQLGPCFCEISVRGIVSIIQKYCSVPLHIFRTQCTWLAFNITCFHASWIIQKCFPDSAFLYFQVKKKEQYFYIVCRQHPIAQFITRSCIVTFNLKFYEALKYCTWVYALLFILSRGAFPTSCPILYVWMWMRRNKTGRFMACFKWP